MAEAQIPTEQKSETKNASNARVFTMPESYRHGKEAKLVEPAKDQKPHAPIAPTPPPVPSPIKVLPKPAAKKHTNRALIISGVLVLIALMIGGYLLVRSTQTKPIPPPIVEQPKPIVQPPVEEPIIPPPEEEQLPLESPFPEEISIGRDSDSDGLTDVEENLIYKTNPSLPDSDADGFLDGNEVFHRYNPNGTAPGTLIEAGIVQVFVGKGIQMSYPVVWQLTSPSTSFDAFVSTSGEVIQLEVVQTVDAADLQTKLSAWFEQQGGQEQIIKTRSKTGYDLYLHQNKRSALFILDGKILYFTYDLGSQTTIDYAQTFQMMLNSIEFEPEV